MKTKINFDCQNCQTAIYFEYNDICLNPNGVCEKCKEEFAIVDDAVFFLSIQRPLEMYQHAIDCPFCKKKFGVIEYLSGKCPECNEEYFWDVDEPLAYSPVFGIQFTNHEFWLMPEYL